MCWLVRGATTTQHLNLHHIYLKNKTSWIMFIQWSSTNTFGSTEQKRCMQSQAKKYYLHVFHIKFNKEILRNIGTNTINILNNSKKIPFFKSGCLSLYHFIVSMIPVKPVPNQLRNSIFCSVDPEYTTGVVLTM